MKIYPEITCESIRLRWPTLVRLTEPHGDVVALWSCKNCYNSVNDCSSIGMVGAKLANNTKDQSHWLSEMFETSKAELFTTVKLFTRLKEDATHQKRCLVSIRTQAQVTTL